jgi:hypothetical protein
MVVCFLLSGVNYNVEVWVELEESPPSPACHPHKLDLWAGWSSPGLVFLFCIGAWEWVFLGFVLGFLDLVFFGFYTAFFFFLIY